MRSEELSALGDLAGDAAGGLATHVQDWHSGIAERVFSSIGPAAQPVRAVHDRVAAGAYAGARRITSTLVRSGLKAAATTRRPDAPSLEESLPGRLAVGALNGAFGDTLQSRGSPLAVRMAVRRHRRDVPPTSEGLRAAFPDATPRLAVFLHGLCETDDAWRRASDRWPSYGTRLRQELGCTPVYLRYNSGRHISQNGRTLARLLDQIVCHWPVEVQELALIGHSMGGLVIRSACHYAAEVPGVGDPWTSKVRHVVSLGTPHAGAPLERLAHGAGYALSRLPETRAIYRALKLRSAGIKDLHHGYLLDDDWGATEDAPEQLMRAFGREIPFLESADHYFVSASLSRAGQGPLDGLLGDLLVIRSSAWAHTRRGAQLRFPVDNYRHYGGATHFDLLSHPAIADQLVKWLSRPALESGAAAA